MSYDVYGKVEDEPEEDSGQQDTDFFGTSN